MKVKFENLENGEIKLIVSLSNEEFEKHREAGFKKVQEFVQIDGFRKGNAPENLIIEKYGEMVILEEMAHYAINDTFYASIIKENENRKEDNKIVPISDPKISIIKIGQGSDFEYNAVFAVLPKIDLIDYKKIAKEESAEVEKEELNELKKKQDGAKREDIFKVEDKEVDEVIETLRKGRTGEAHIHEDGTVCDHSHDESEENPSHGEGGERSETEGVKKENKKDAPSLGEGAGDGLAMPKKESSSAEASEGQENLPELNDEFAQSFGDKFKTLEDLKAKIKENLILEKKAKIQERKRAKILDRMVSETKINLPKVLIENELERMKMQMKADIERFGSKWEDYLSHLKKTEEALKDEWRDVAYKRIVSQLLINEIAKKEKIGVTPEEIDAEAIKIMSQMPEANETNVKSYIHQILQNEKVMKFLDGEEK